MNSAMLAATDPANPYGAALRFPAPNGDTAAAGRGPTRSVGATVVLVDGALAAYIARGDRLLLTWLPEMEPQRTRTARAVAHALLERVRGADDGPRSMLIEEIDGMPPQAHTITPFLVEAGFVAGALGLHAPRS